MDARRMKLNADLGENEPPERTRALMPLLDLASVACGGHAGDDGTMRRAVRLAVEAGVEVGAHPGLPGNFGRAGADISVPDFRELLVSQAGRFAAICRREQSVMQHIKLHGALYHAVENSPHLAQAYVAAVQAHFPQAAIIAFAGGTVIAAARENGAPALAEVFAERGYRPDGSLIPRGQPGDLITDPAEAAARVSSLRGDTICVHADTPNAVRIAQAVRSVLG